MIDRRRSRRTALALACLSLLAPASASAAQHVVDDDRMECPSAGFTAIADAIAAAAPGDTVSVCDGAYLEGAAGPGATALTIDKPLTLRGAGAGRVYVGPAGDLAAAAPDAHDAAGNIISVVGVRADISGLTIHGAGRHVEAGVAYLNADGKVSSVEIVDLVRPAGQFDGVTGVGYLAWGGEADRLRSVTLEDSLIEGYDAAGAVVDAAPAAGGSRTSSSFGVFALLTGNRITGAGAGGGIAGQDGYRLLNRASTVAIENAFTDNADAGIDVQNSISTSQTRFNINSIQRNRVGFRHEAAFAICTQDPGRTNRYRLDAVQNWWGSPAGPSTDDVAGRGDAVSGTLAAPTGCTATTGTPDTTDRLDFRRYLQRPAPVPTPLGKFQDAQPTVAITAPAAGTKLVAGTPVTITADAADDIGVREVTFLRGDQVLAVDREAPYAATYTPQGEEAWSAQSIVAVATDSRGQSTAAAVSVGASDDAGPVVALDRPIRDGYGYFLAATATDDRGVAQVTFFVDGERECVDTTAPYTCRVSPDFVPGGKLSVVAIATDTAGQTGTDLRSLRFPDRIWPRELTLRADLSRRTVEAAGRLRLPPGVDDRDGCRGRVVVTLRRRDVIVGRKRVKLDRDCRYDAALKVRNDGRHRVTARFQGNDILRPASANPIEVKVR